MYKKKIGKRKVYTIIATNLNKLAKWLRTHDPQAAHRSLKGLENSQGVIVIDIEFGTFLEKISMRLHRTNLDSEALKINSAFS